MNSETLETPKKSVTKKGRKRKGDEPSQFCWICCRPFAITYGNFSSKTGYISTENMYSMTDWQVIVQSAFPVSQKREFVKQRNLRSRFFSCLALFSPRTFLPLICIFSAFLVAPRIFAKEKTTARTLGTGLIYKVLLLNEYGDPAHRL